MTRKHAGTEIRDGGKGVRKSSTRRIAEHWRSVGKALAISWYILAKWFSAAAASLGRVFWDLGAAERAGQRDGGSAKVSLRG